MGKKIAIFILAIAIVVVVVFIGARFMTDEDSWLCVNGEWVKHGNPSAPMPDLTCGKLVELENIKVSAPRVNETVTSPILIKGEAIGPWFFEGDFPVKLVGPGNKILAENFVTAKGDWMVEEFVQFEGEIQFSVLENTNAKLVLMKNNPSDKSELDESIEIPLILKAPEKITVKVFFPSKKEDPNLLDCSKVFPVEREIAFTQGVARASLEELFEGPRRSESTEEYYTVIQPGVKINKLEIKNKTAFVDFSSELESNVGGSCNVTMIRAQIEETLKQFPTIDNVVISINGKPDEEILQP